jgi:hypothetical protein
VRQVNAFKGRPPGQVGSTTTTPSRVADVFDWSRRPAALTRSRLLDVVDDLLSRGPFGFRGPAAPSLPAHLTQRDGDVVTAQVISPGWACACNALFAAALRCTGGDLLHITSANRSRHATGAVEEPAHCTARGVRADFGSDPRLQVLEHRDEAAARARYPGFAPMSTSILALHRTTRDGDGRTALVLERHGSLPAGVVAEVLAAHDLGLVLGPRALVRLPQRDPLAP